VHYSYTGTISTINGYRETVNNKYIYPYFSDEWVEMSLVKYSIENEKLPIVNPLINKARFISPVLPFFSFLSEVFLILKLDPLTQFPFLSILSGLSICSLIYLILRKIGIGTAISLLIFLSIPYITNGANLPGIWFLIPLIMGIILFLLSVLSFISENKKLALINSILSVIFYPPMIVFSFPILIIIFLRKEAGRNNRWLIISGVILFIILASTSYFIFKEGTWGYLMSLIFRTNLESGIPQFNPLNIIPLWLLIPAILGIFTVLKKRLWIIICPILVGAIFWCVYLFTQKVFIIDYPRVVVITSLLISILSGMGIRLVVDKINSKCSWQKRVPDLIWMIIIVSTFAIASPYYTANSSWKRLTMNIGVGQKEILPASPSNTYLTNDDLRLFQNIKKKRFISVPWKGLVIGAATGNYPIESKASIITNKLYSYNGFMSGNCTTKINTSDKFRIDYVYSRPFSCDFFEKIGESEEGLILYKFSNKR
jgi:hypothetical protein